MRSTNRVKSIRRPAWLVLALLLLMAGGCSRTEFAYRNADWFLEAYADRALAVDREQLENWRPTLDRVLERHRRELLPRIIEYLDLLERAAQSPPEPRLVDCVLDAGVRLYREHARLAVDLAVPLLATLDDAQIRHLEEYLAEDQKEKRERYLKANLEERQAARLERFTERTEKWIGRLDREQRQLLDRTVGRIPDLSAYWLDYRAQQTQDLLAMLEAGADEAQVRDLLTGWWVKFEQRPAAYSRAWVLAKRGSGRFLQQLGDSLTARQRTRFEERIADLRRDLETFLTPPQPTAKLPEGLLCTDAPTGEAAPKPRL